MIQIHPHPRVGPSRFVSSICQPLFQTAIVRRPSTVDRTYGRTRASYDRICCMRPTDISISRLLIRASVIDSDPAVAP